MQIEFTKDQLDLVISAVVCRIAQALEGPQDDPLVISLLERLRAENERLMKIREAA